MTSHVDIDLGVNDEGREGLDGNNIVVAVRFTVHAQQRTVGLCCCSPRPRKHLKDSICWHLETYEFVDNGEFSNLDMVLVQLGPSTALVTLDKQARETGVTKGELGKLVGLLERHRVVVKHTSIAEFKVDPEDLSGKLRRLLSDGSMLAHFCSEVERPLATGCLAAILSSSVCNMDAEPDGSCDIKLASLGIYTKLDSSAAEAVMLLPDPSMPKSRTGSIFGVLNHCKTKMGTRMLERWLRQPLRYLRAIEARQELVGLFCGAASLRAMLRDGPLRTAPDLDAIKIRMQKSRGGLMEVFKLYAFSRTIPNFIDALSAEAEIEFDESEVDLLQSHFVQRFKSLKGDLAGYQVLVENVMDLSQLPDCVVNPAYSSELQDLRNDMNEVMEEINDIYAVARDGWCDFGNKAPLHLEPDKVRGFVFRLSKANLGKELPSRKRNVEIVSILKNGVHFTTPDLRQAGKMFRDLKNEYSEKQEDLVSKAVETASTYLPVMEMASDVVAELDVLVGMAHAAAMAPTEYVRPTLREPGTGVLKVTGARHPCIEYQDGVSFIPNSYDMSKEKGRFVIVTGPNMCGKSTFIRTLGSIVVMAQVGSFVPADSAEISIVDAVFARMGAGDAQQRGVSTFMAEMLEASAIISTASDQSLIIIDELGRGTSTFDGFGLAWAISEHLVRETRAFTLFATHFHEMTTLAEKESCVQNRHVSARIDKDKIIMLYKVNEGPCLESFGIHVAQMACFPSRVIRASKRKARELERFENVLETLEERGGCNNQNENSMAESARAFAKAKFAQCSPEEALRQTRVLVEATGVPNGE